MKSVDQTLPNDAESLVKIVLSQRQALAEKEAKIDHQTDYIKQLIEAIQLAKHQHFGARSEKFNVDQLSLLFNEAELLLDHQDDQQPNDHNSTDETTTVGSHQRKKGGRRKLPDHYPRIEIIHTLEGDHCQCEHCDGELAVIGEKTSEQIDLVPMRVQVIRHIL